MVNVSIKVDGKRPIGARVRRISEPQIVLLSRSGPLECSMTTKTVCKELTDLDDHCQPHAPGKDYSSNQGHLLLLHQPQFYAFKGDFVVS